MWVDFLGETQFRFRELDRRQALQDLAEVEGHGLSHKETKVGGLNQWIRSLWENWRIRIRELFAKRGPAVITQNADASRVIRSSQEKSGRFTRRELETLPAYGPDLVMDEYTYPLMWGGRRRGFFW